MIIDCHGHYTTAPTAHDAWRDGQKAAFKAGGDVDPAYPAISDDEIRETIEKNQLRLLRERGADMTIFSPRASTMAHHVGDEAVSQAWTRRCNDLIKRVVNLYPETFIGVCQLPQSPGVPIDHSIAELERCVTALNEAIGRMRQTIVVVWYPIKDERQLKRFYRDMQKSAAPKLLRAELFVHPADDAGRLNGSGLLISNPPWGLEEELRALLPIVTERLPTLGAIGDLVGFLWVEELEVDPALLVPKRWDAATTEAGLAAARRTIADVGELAFEADEIEPRLRALAEANGWKAGDLFMAIRVAITGRTATPPLFDTMVALGRDRTLERLDRAIATLDANSTEVGT